jgi:molybdopterin converting factor small subunit
MQARINIQLFFFASTRDIFGADRMDLTVDEGSTVDDVIQVLRKQFPHVKLPRLLYSVNQTYAGSEKTLTDRDEVAIFTAVSGG